MSFDPSASLEHWSAEEAKSRRWWRRKRKGDPRRTYWYHRLKHAKAMVAKRRRQLAEQATHVTGISALGLSLIKSFEGFRGHAYRDAVGVLTIGYGETRGVTPGQTITEPAAAARLKARVNRDFLAPVLAIAKAHGVRLAQHEADALASVAYNLGAGVFDAGHSLGDALRTGDRKKIAAAILLYDKAGGHTLPGLTRRRQAERRLFLTGKP